MAVAIDPQHNLYDTHAAEYTVRSQCVRLARQRFVLSVLSLPVVVVASRRGLSTGCALRMDHARTQVRVCDAQPAVQRRVALGVVEEHNERCDSLAFKYTFRWFCSLTAAVHSSLKFERRLSSVALHCRSCAAHCDSGAEQW